eukprot:TRINITY_DN16600_c0_g1_i4.p1 TRINITY_DN16600_c0_g1~~TRINITY_DN16600_c0_g1_i4.p1  ORF type:complete len:249 (+),score=37.50 TRINITY_DN16600_c0_g1_i4:3-749(+)
MCGASCNVWCAACGANLSLLKCLSCRPIVGCVSQSLFFDLFDFVVPFLLLQGLVTLHSWSIALLGILHDLFENASVRLLSAFVCVASCAGAIPFAVGSIGYDMVTEMDRFFVRTAVPLAAVCQAVSAGYLTGRRDSDVQDVADRINKNGKHQVPWFWAYLLRLSPVLMFPVAVGGVILTVRESHQIEHTVVAIAAVLGYPLLLIGFACHGARVARQSALSAADIWSDKHITGHAATSIATSDIHLPRE